MADEKDIQQLINELKDVRDALPEALKNVATSMSLTGKAMAERSIKDKGFGQVYSAAEIPAYFFKGFTSKKGKTYLPKYINNRGLKAIEDVEKEQAKENRQNDTNFRARMSFKELRKAQGLPIDHVDLTYSGKMWAGMGPLPVEVNGYEYVAPLGGFNNEAQDKMNWNYQRYGDFMAEALTGDYLEKIYEIGISELMRFMGDKLNLTITP